MHHLVAHDIEWPFPVPHNVQMGKKFLIICHQKSGIKTQKQILSIITLAKQCRHESFNEIDPHRQCCQKV